FMAGLFIYGSLLSLSLAKAKGLRSHSGHLSFKVNTLLGFISCWQREQFLLTIQKIIPRERRRLRKVRVKISLFMVGLLFWLGLLGFWLSWLLVNCPIMSFH